MQESKKLYDSKRKKKDKRKLFKDSRKGSKRIQIFKIYISEKRQETQIRDRNKGQQQNKCGILETRNSEMIRKGGLGQFMSCYSEVRYRNMEIQERSGDIMRKIF